MFCSALRVLLLARSSTLAQRLACGERVSLCFKTTCRVPDSDLCSEAMQTRGFLRKPRHQASGKILASFFRNCLQASEHPHKLATPLSQSLHGEITRTRFAKQSFECAVGRAVPHARQPHLCATGSPAAAPRRHSGTGDASGSHHCARRSAAGSTCGTAPRPAARRPARARNKSCRAPPNNRRRSRPAATTII